MSASRESQRPSLGVTPTIAVILCLYGIGGLIAVAGGATIQGIQLTWADAGLPLFLVLVGLGILRRTLWGRWLGYLVSLPLLVGVPIGTIIGGFLILHLTRYRRSF